jgi:ectoine hydroxylase-related dioxygenase (phytanoyl-CoA dioxygenase family)
VFIVILHLIPTSQNPHQAFYLEPDGAQLFKSAIPLETAHRWKTMCANKQYKELKAEMHSDQNLQKIVHSISAKHEFQDYIWIIEKSAVHTCHRDNNGTFFNAGQKHPSYTMIVYLDQGMSQDKCLGVIPKSHKSKYANAVNVVDQVTDIRCATGDVIVFNANLIHVGTITARDDNLRVQMKISHPEDLNVLSYYQNFNKVLNKDNQNSKTVRQIQRHVSCSVPFVSDLTQTENIRTSQGTAGGAKISDAQKWFSYLFYGRTDFYDLPNAW